jgi:hypothetical protein
MSLDYSMIIIQRGMVERTCSNNAKQVLFAAELEILLWHEGQLSFSLQVADHRAFCWS